MHRRWLFGMMLGVGLATGCATPPVPWPTWVVDHKVEDSVCFYALGHAQHARSESEAVDLAFRDGVAQLAAGVLPKGGASGKVVTNGPALELRGVDKSKGGSMAQRRVGGWEAYVLVSWPRTEHDRTVERLNLGGLLNARWDEANALASARQWDGAISRLEALLAEFQDPLNVRFTLEAARKMLTSVKQARRAAELNEMWSQAQAAVQAGRQVEARALLDRLLVDAPSLSPEGPPIERIKLLSCDCYVQLGQPRRAVQTCQSILAASRDPVFQKEAATRLDKVQSDYTNLLFRGALGGRKVVVCCVTELDGVTASWSKMQKEMESFVLRAGGTVVARGETAMDISLAAGLLVRPEARSAVTQPVSADGLLLAIARGRINKRPNSQNKVTGEDVQFSGTVTCMLDLSGRGKQSWEWPGVTGWNPLGPEMCLGVLALNVLEAWQGHVVEQLDAP
jgi:hypothetical protein